MDVSISPEVRIQKNSIPIIYLDSCILIELARYASGQSSNAYKREIGELYDVLISLMRQKRILCPSGNQLQEMGVSKGREMAKNFLFRFTNAELYNPCLVEETEMDLGYQAYIARTNSLDFNCSLVLKEKRSSDFPFVVHVSPIYSRDQLEKLKQEKLNGIAILNEMKKNGSIAANYETQLKNELESDFYFFLRSMENYNNSFEAFVRYSDQLAMVYKRTGIYVEDLSDSRILDAVDKHNRFLLSEYHHKLPYKWIEAVLWTHRMQRPNKIVQGDNMDTVWAAAYLPFVDYVVTDNAFCALLKQSDLAELYKAKVYCFKTLDSLLEDLKKYSEQ